MALSLEQCSRCWSVLCWAMYWAKIVVKMCVRSITVELNGSGHTHVGEVAFRALRLGTNTATRDVVSVHTRDQAHARLSLTQESVVLVVWIATAELTNRKTRENRMDPADKQHARLWIMHL